MNMSQMLVPVSKYGIKCPYAMQPKFIVVHNTANNAKAMSEASYMLGNNNYVSYHVVIDDHRIIQTVPFNRNAWHCGATYGNRNAIGIEICYSRSGGALFTKAEDLAAQYIAYLLKQYGWGLDKVQTHQMQSGKYCPHRTLDMGWQRFLNLVAKYLNGAKPIAPKPEKPKEQPNPEHRNIYANPTRRDGYSRWWNGERTLEGKEFGLIRNSKTNGVLSVQGEAKDGAKVKTYTELKPNVKKQLWKYVPKMMTSGQDVVAGYYIVSAMNENLCLCVDEKAYNNIKLVPLNKNKDNHLCVWNIKEVGTGQYEGLCSIVNAQTLYYLDGGGKHIGSKNQHLD